MKNLLYLKQTNKTQQNKNQKKPPTLLCKYWDVLKLFWKQRVFGLCSS